MNKAFGYFFFSVLWLIEVYLISLDWDKLAGASPLYWILVGLATVTLSHTISFYAVGAWFRAPFVREVKDTAGGVVGLEAKPGRWQVLGELITCPICSGTHGATLLLLVFTVNEDFGWALAAAAALSSVNMLLHWTSELLQWQGRYYIEKQGELWLRKNHGDMQYMVEKWVGGQEEDEYTDRLDRYLDTLDPEELARRIREGMHIG